MTIRTVSTTEGNCLHYRLEADNAAEITARILTIRGEAALAGGRCSSTSPHRMPNNLFRAVVWVDPQN